MHDPERDIRDFPLSQLELSPGNVRKTPADASAFTELKASIAAHGLLENLIARAMEPDTDCVARYAVIAGGRRLAAMQALAAEGALEEDHPVPCRMIEDIVAAEEVSLAENTVRTAMHPADQVEAFRRLADAGSTAAAIAARFGVSERTVEKRLRLGNAAPVLLEAYRAGEIDLETLMAFAVTTDQARQSAVWETVSQQGYRPGAWQIKRLLTEDRVSATSAIARFVGIEAYEAAGGRIDRDLFAEEDERGIWFDDPDLLNKLAMDSLQVAARELETRWKWAEARLDVDWSATAAFGRVRPQPAEPTDEEKAEIERLRTRNDELANMDDEDWTEELGRRSRCQRDPARRDRGHDRGPRGLPARGYRYRRVHRHRRQRRRAQTDPGPGQARGHARARSRRCGRGRTRRYCRWRGTPSPALMRPHSWLPSLLPAMRKPRRARKRASASASPTILRAIRTAIVKSQLACDFEAAFDLLLFQLARSVFTSGYHDDALDIRATETRTVRPCGSTTMLSATINVGEKHLEIDRAAQKLDWTGLSDAEAFAELRALPERDKHISVRVLRRTHAKGPTGVRTQGSARGRSDRGPARHRLRRRRPRQPRSGLDRRSAVVAACARTASSPLPARRWARPGRKRKPSRRRRRSPRRCRTPSPTATACPPGSRPRAAPRPSPGRRPASAPSIPALSTTVPSADDDRDNRPRTATVDDRIRHRSMRWNTDSDRPIGRRMAKPRKTDAYGRPMHYRAMIAEPAPVGAQQPMNARVHSVVESIDAPAVAERRAAALASNVNADATPPVAASVPEDGRPAPPAIAGAGGHDNVPVEPERVMAPPRGNGHDNKAELLEIPAFLRRG